MHVIAAKAVCSGRGAAPGVCTISATHCGKCKGAGRSPCARGPCACKRRHGQPPDDRRPAQHRCDGQRAGGPAGRECASRQIKTLCPNDPASPFVTSGLRIGTPAVTTRGFGEAEMKAIARCIADTVFRFEETRQHTLETVQALTERFPLYE